MKGDFIWSSSDESVCRYGTKDWGPFLSEAFCSSCTKYYKRIHRSVFQIKRRGRRSIFSKKGTGKKKRRRSEYKTSCSDDDHVGGHINITDVSSVVTIFIKYEGGGTYEKFF